MRDRAAFEENVRRLSEGDGEAFEPVFAELWPLFRAFARRQVGDAEADDVAQSALLKVFSRARLFDPRRDALAWCLGVVAWEARTSRRRSGRRREVPDDALAASAAAGADPEAAAIAASQEARLEHALEQLSAADRETLSALASGERPAGAAFRKRLQRALERLRMAWGQG